MNSKKVYLAFLIFLLFLTLGLSGLLINKILKNEATNDVRYMKTTINNIKSDDMLAMANIKKAPIVIKNIQSEESPNTLSYDYKIKIDGVVGSVKYKYGDKESYLVFDSTNEAKFTLNSNEEFIIYDIALNKNYTITQSTKSEYKTVNSGDSTNVFNGVVGEENVIEFKNTSSLVTTNPNTASGNMMILVLVDVLVLIGLVVLKKTKVQRYEV